jgi:uncharacterized protein (TIGR02217 family)
MTGIPTFPTLIGLTFPVKYSPSWRTIIQEAMSGKDTRVQLFTYPRYKYEIGVSYLGAGSNWRANADWSTLVGFFNSVGGAALPFHWNNPYDNAAVNQQLGLGDGSNKNFNFIRSLGGFLEPVQDVTAVSNVKVNGVTTVAYTLLTDPNFGLTYGISLTSAPGAGQAVVASFTYNWCVQFDKDTADFENFLFTYWNLKKISFETKKVL